MILLHPPARFLQTALFLIAAALFFLCPVAVADDGGDKKSAPSVRERLLPNFESRIEFTPSGGVPSFYYIDDSKARARIRERPDEGRLRMWNLFEFRARPPAQNAQP
jgi:hypothetical protein